MTASGRIAEVSRLVAEGHGDRSIAGHLGITRHQARNLIREAERAAVPTMPGPARGGSLTRYEAARQALAEAVRVDEVVEIHLPRAAAMKAYAIQAGDKEMVANAIDYRDRAERRLGELLLAQKQEFGLAKGGRPAKPVPTEEQVSEPEITLADLGIDRKLSSRSQRKAGIALEAFDQMMAARRERILAGKDLGILKEISTEEKQQRRANRERVLAGIINALPDKKYGVILADPEWRFEPWSRETGLDRSPDNHYPTSCTEVIAARDVPSIAAPDCVLFLWATGPMNPHALLVMAAWGFDYKSQYVWGKDKAGTGYWSRERHELLLIGTRGNVPCPAPGTQWDSLIEAPRGAHSEKPEAVLEMIEQYFPTLPKIELNARRRRSGWDVWGLEAPHDPKTGEIIEPHEDAT